IHNFQLQKTDDLMSLRKKILQRSIELFETYEEKVIEILGKYSWTSKDIDPSLYQEEQEFLGAFLNQHLNPFKYSHCKLVRRYTETLKEHGVPIQHDWSKFLDSESMNIADIFTDSFNDHLIDYDEMKEAKKSKIKELVSGKDINFIQNLLEQISHVYNESPQDFFTTDRYLSDLFCILADQDKSLYLATLELVMQEKFDFNFYHSGIIYYPVRNNFFKATN